jgi:hypothetical protein
MSRLSSFARVATASALISIIATQPAWAWGSDGHMLINRLAAQYLPSDVPAFLRNGNGIDVIEYLGPEPDRWKSRAEPQLAATSSPDHFIDLEWADLARIPCTAATDGCGPDHLMLPRLRYDYVRQVEIAAAAHPDLKLTAEKIGFQPWQTEEVWQRLKADFREYRKLVADNKDTAPVQVAILFDAGWLGHYVGDGSMPLHTSIQYNGWTGPNPNGYTTEHRIHGLFESANVAANVKIADVAPLVAASKATVIADEWTGYLDYLHHTHSLVEKTYQLEKAGGFKDAGTPEGKAFTDERLAAGAIELRDMIYSAWVHSADPVPEYHSN